MKLTFCCEPSNDLYLLLKREGIEVERFADPSQAVNQVDEGGSLLLLASGYPERPTAIEDRVLEQAAEEGVRVYLEFPRSLPGLQVGAPRKTLWERQIVTTSRFGPQLPPLSLLHLHDCRYVPVAVPDPWIVTGRVAGYDRAVYGLPHPADPLLFELSERQTLVATSRLSHFITGRFGPLESWKLLWEHLLHWLTGNDVLLRYPTPVVPAYAYSDPFPPTGEALALEKAAGWYRRSRLFVHPSESDELKGRLARGEEVRPALEPDAPTGEGSCGILEGYASAIEHDGSQPQRIPLRADCQTESAMVLALYGAQDKDAQSRETAIRLLDYLFFHSGMHGGVRGEVTHPAYGLIAWGAHSPAWEVANYGDDNARTLLGAILAASSLEEDRWDGVIVKAILANFRTTGPLGFRGDRIDLPELEGKGWRHFYERERVNLSPHFEAYLWACYLWAYRLTGFQPFLERTKRAIRTTMEAFPDGWRWGSNLESARMLLPLAWLLRLEHSEEHRTWLHLVLEDLLETQVECGALRERFRGTKSGHFTVPESNEAYGVKETPLLQENGDPVSDQLYTTGFALFGLHEANAVLTDDRYREAEDRLTEYLCRIQITAPSLPYLDGAWFRAFDFERWEYWASSGDEGWGAWCVESGWGGAWTAAALGLRQRGITFWDATAPAFQSSMALQARELLQTMELIPPPDSFEG